MSKFSDYMTGLSPIAYWRLGESLGATSGVDEMGNDALTYTNSPQLEESSLIVGDTDTSVRLVGASSHIAHGNNKQYEYGSVAQNFALYSIIKPEATFSGGVLCFGNRASYGYGIFLQSDKKILIFVGDTAGNKIEYESNTVLTDGSAYNLYMDYDGTAIVSGLRLFINGSLDTGGTNIETDTLSSQIGSANQLMYIGSEVATNRITATIDDSAVFSKRLSILEIEHLNYLTDEPNSPTLTPEAGVLELTGAPLEFTQDGNLFLDIASASLSLTGNNLEIETANIIVVSEAIFIGTFLSSLALSLGINESINISSSESNDVFIIRKLTEELNVDDYVNTTLTGNVNLQENIAFIDELTLSLQLILTSSLTVNATADEVHICIQNIIELINTTDIITNNIKAKNVITEALLAFDTLQMYSGFALQDGIVVSDTAEVILNAVVALLQALTINDSLSYVFNAVTFLSDEFDISDNVVSSAIFTQAVLESIMTFGSIVIDNEHYTFVMNVETKGVSEYSNFNFNSMSSGLGATSTGIYRLIGTDDAGSNIDAYIKTGLIDFGTSLEKQVPYAYIGLNKSGDMLLKTIVDYRGSRKERWYEVAPKAIDATDTIRVSLGRGVKSRYWQFELTNKDGSDFEIDSIELLPLILKRRI